VFTLSELADFLKEKGLIGTVLNYENDKEIKRFSSLAHPSKDALCWSKRLLPIDEVPECGVLLCLPEQEANPDRATVIIRTVEPRRAFGMVVDRFYPEESKTGISKDAVIDESAKIGLNVYIGPGCIIGSGCVIGDDTRLDANVTIYDNVKIGRRCHISGGAVIGADGHGYVLDENNRYKKIRHMGGVSIGDDVDIGANTCVDRGVLDDTIIGNNTKIDNLVQVAHNVQIGENCMITGGCQIGGSCVIGRDCWLAPSAVIRNGVSIANEVRVCMKSVVYQSVKQDRVTVYGDPAKVIMPYKIDEATKI